MIAKKARGKDGKQQGKSENKGKRSGSRQKRGRKMEK